MKKVITTSLIIAAGLTLVSCGSSKSSAPKTVDTGIDTAVYTEYIKDKITYSTVLNQEDVTKKEEAGKSYYAVYLPTSIDSSKYVNVMDASRFDSKNEEINVRYASTYSWSAGSYETIIDIVDSAEVGAFKEFETEVETPENYLTTTNKDERVLCVVYLPVKVVYAKYISKKLSKTTISYVLVPTYAALTTKTNDVIADATVASMQKMTFTVKKGAIK